MDAFTGFLLIAIIIVMFILAIIVFAVNYDNKKQRRKTHYINGVKVTTRPEKKDTSWTWGGIFDSDDSDRGGGGSDD